MLNFVAFSNKLIVFWDLPAVFTDGDSYCVRCAGKKSFVQKTHCSFDGLKPLQEYSVEVEVVDKEGNFLYGLGELRVRLPAARRMLDVTKPPYNAIGDGETMNTAALQKAIDDCMAGETVYIPEGIFLSGALNLHDDIELYLDEGAVLQGSEAVEDYLPKRKSRFEGVEMDCYSSLLNVGSVKTEGGYTCRNVTIRGGGCVRGGGNSLCENVIRTERDYLIKNDCEFLKKAKECEFMDTIPGRARPRLINVSSSQNVIIDGIIIENGPSWNLHILYSDCVVVTGCTFRSDGIHNGDGCDPDSSTNCTIFNCDFFTYDDCVAIKSGKNPEGNIINRPCKNIKIFDCRSTMGHGCSIGSEISGGVSDVSIWDCDFEKSMFGITIKATKKRGGYVRNVAVKRCKSSRIMVRVVPYNDDGVAASTVPVFENFVFENVSLTGIEWARETEQMFVPSITLTGFDDLNLLNNVYLRNIALKKRTDGKPHTTELNFLNGVFMENLLFE